MYIIKNALRSISRARVRNLLIGIIALVIAVSACVALSIREAAQTAKQSALENLTVTAQIAADRTAMMQQAKDSFDPSTAGGSGQSFDRSAMKDMLSQNKSLSLDELEIYAKADTVKNFYYNITTSLDAGEGLVAYGSDDTDDSTDTDSTTEDTMPDDMPGGTPGGNFGGKGGMQSMILQGDFSLTGYSADEAMVAFQSGGTCAIAADDDGNALGQIFDEGTTDAVCIISNELADYNELSVGDTITLANPNNADETYTLTVCGIYENSAADAENGMFASTDSANNIYMSYPALKAIIDAAETDAETVTDDDGNEISTALQSEVSGTYTFATVDDYEAFAEDVYDMGLSTDYTVSSTDISSYEASLEPLNNLSTTATWFLLVVFAIGAIILVVLNIFNIRERKYEIGVLCAIGMKKTKVAAQFVCELFCVTFAAILIGAVIGAATSVPVTNALLADQIESTEQAQENVTQNFGRGSADGESSDAASAPSDMPSAPDGASGFGGKMQNMFSGIGAGAVDYVSEISYATDLVVILELIAVGILLTLISALFAVCSIMRYEPLKILSNRE